MIVDTSVVVAILLKEPEHDRLIELLGTARQVGIGAPTLTEAAIVLSARIKKDARGMLARFCAEAGVVTVPFGEEHFSVAADAWLRFGKGRHPAALNLGDCMTYATASLAAEPLLCIGDDFSKTDLALV